MEAQLTQELEDSKSSPFIIHVFTQIEDFEKVNLSKITKLCQVLGSVMENRKL